MNKRQRSLRQARKAVAERFGTVDARTSLGVHVQVNAPLTALGRPTVVPSRASLHLLGISGSASERQRGQGSNLKAPRMPYLSSGASRSKAVPTPKARPTVLATALKRDATLGRSYSLSRGSGGLGKLKGTVKAKRRTLSGKIISSYRPYVFGGIDHNRYPAGVSGSGATLRVKGKSEVRNSFGRLEPAPSTLC